MNCKKHMRGILCTLIGGISWGFSGACGQLLVQHSQVSSLWVTMMRMLCSGITLTLFNIISKRKTAFQILKHRKNIVGLALFGILGILASQFTYLQAISYSNAGTATVLQYMGPIFIIIYVCITTMRLPDRFEIISFLLAFTGVVVLATHGDFTSLTLSKECLFWGLLSAVSLMLYTLLPQRLMSEYGALLTVGYSMLIGGLFLLIILRPQFTQISYDAFWALSGMIFVGTVFAYTLYLQGVSDIGGVKASMIACVEPVSAAIISCVWLGTEFQIIDIVGFILILSTVFILAKSKK